MHILAQGTNCLSDATRCFGGQRGDAGKVTLLGTSTAVFQGQFLLENRLWTYSIFRIVIENYMVLG